MEGESRKARWDVKRGLRRRRALSWRAHRLPGAHGSSMRGGTRKGKEGLDAADGMWAAWSCFGNGRHPEWVNFR